MSTDLIPQNQLLRHHQREDLKQEIKGMSDMLPNLKSHDDRGQVVSRMKRLERSLIAQSPPELSASEKNVLYKESKKLEEEFTQGMLSREEMRKNPAGSVGQHMRWERENKQKILRWKNLQQVLDPQSDDPDLSNYERLRPNGAVDRFRSDAQITGKMSYLNVPQENWDQAFEGKGPTNSALQQAQRVEEEQKTRKSMSEEAREAARQRLVFAREKQRQLREADIAAPILEGEAVPRQES